jgi:hypothetical protein
MATDEIRYEWNTWHLSDITQSVTNETWLLFWFVSKPLQITKLEENTSICFKSYITDAQPPQKFRNHKIVEIDFQNVSSAIILDLSREWKLLLEAVEFYCFLKSQRRSFFLRSVAIHFAQKILKQAKKRHIKLNTVN